MVFLEANLRVGFSEIDSPQPRACLKSRQNWGFDSRTRGFDRCLDLSLEPKIILICDKGDLVR